jgi:SAM-dependent methyltransferase
MTASVALRRIEPEALPQPVDDRLDRLVESVRNNRFLPCPPADSIYVGDGDFRAIGAEFLGHLVGLGGLRRDDRVLDIGCGIGRMAVPLTQYLDPEKGSYDGVDPVLEGVMWCAQTITAAYPRFHFQRLDIDHPIYNPGGSLPGREVSLGFASASFDFAMMISVATHLPAEEVEVYCREISRVLAPGGRLFLTAFLVSPQRLGVPSNRLPFKRWGSGPAWCIDQAAPLGATGFDQGFIESVVDEAGLVIERVSLGNWNGQPAGHYQDIVIATKPGKRA